MNDDILDDDVLDEWYLEGFVDEGAIIRRVSVSTLPFLIGRQPRVSLQINAKDISKLHAEIFGQNSQLFIRDLGSTNGTFVNNLRIQESVPIREGDIIHFGKNEFRLAYEMAPESYLSDSTAIFSGELPHDFETRTEELKIMLEKGAVIPHFQPLVKFSNGKRFGFEILGRGNLEDFEIDPVELFNIASSIKLEGDLSHLFRVKGIEVGSEIPGAPDLFVNTHPSEINEMSRLLSSLQEIRNDYPSLKLTVEIHETSVSDLSAMRSFRSFLNELDIGLAYDDFGAGQSRLLELVDVPPDYLKFDKSLIRDIHRARIKRQRMVEMFVLFLRETGVKSLAEGITCQEEAKVCEELGFDCGQGYYFGRPLPADALD